MHSCIYRVCRLGVRYFRCNNLDLQTHCMCEGRLVLSVLGNNIPHKPRLTKQSHQHSKSQVPAQVMQVQQNVTQPKTNKSLANAQRPLRVWCVWLVCVAWCVARGAWCVVVVFVSAVCIISRVRGATARRAV